MEKSAIKLRSIFMGTSEFAAEILSSLLESKYNIISVYTQPDKKVGRNQEIKKSEVKILAEKNKLIIHQPLKFDEKAFNEIKSQKPDLIILAAYGKIIPKSILDIPGFGAINVHASILPKFRGPSPIQNAILLGEKETGITIMLMNEKIDAGDILTQKKIKIGKDQTAQELSGELSKVASRLLLDTIPQWVERIIVPVKQDDSKATICQLIDKSDGRIFWTDDADTIYNKFRAFFSWPGIFTYFESDGSTRRLKLNKISCIRNNPETKHHIGEVFRIGEKVGVQTTSGVIILETVQIEGKTSVNIEDFVNGYQDFIGTILK